MTHHLDLETVLLVARRATGAEPLVADYGLLESALARPRSTVVGHDAYPTLHRAAAALLHSLAKNPASSTATSGFVTSWLLRSSVTM